MSLKLEIELQKQLDRGEIEAGSARAEAAQRLIVSSKNYREQLENPQAILAQAIAEYKNGVRTAEMWAKYWRTKYQVVGAGLGIDLSVPDCPWSEEEIRRPMVDISGKEIPGIMVAVIKDATLPNLGRMYPKMQSATLREGSPPVTDTHNTIGWVKVYGSVDAPNHSITWSDIQRFAKEKGYRLGREKTYILGGQASHDLQGKYFDQRLPFSRNPGSFMGSEPVCSRFDKVGRLFADHGPGPEIAGILDGGWRLEEVRIA